MSHEKIVTMYSNIAQAEGAKRSLIKAGFPEHDIDVLSGDRLRAEGHEARHPSLWQRLFGDTVDADQSSVYEDAISAGGVVVTLRADEEQLPRALTILDAHDSIDTPPRNSLGLNNGADKTATATPHLNTAKTDTTHAEPLRTSLSGDESEEDVLRLAEERLEVGKRLVSEGSTRVRRYTVTDQVSQDISLQEQHADIFRRSADKPVTGNDVDWSEKTVEVAETHEQPVINKTTQVKEEVVVRKDVNDRVETINDSVRRQEVDIDHTSPDHLAGSTVKTGTASSAAATVPGTAVPGTSADHHDHKESLGEKLSDKVSEAKDKVENKFNAK